MAKTLSDHLLHTLESLVAYDLEKFKFKLQNVNLDKDRDRIPQGRLQDADRPVKLAALLVNSYGEKYAVKLTLQVLQAINQNLLMEELSKATNSEHLTQESVREILRIPTFSRETGSKLETTVPLKRAIKNPDADLEDPCEANIDGLQLPVLSHQLYAEQECQKKFQWEQEDQRTINSSHMTEIQERHRNHSVDPEGNRYEYSEVAVTLEQKANKNQKPFFFLGEKKLEKHGFGASLGEQNYYSNQKSVNKRPGNPEVAMFLEEQVVLPESQGEKILVNMDTSLSSGKKEPKSTGNQCLKENSEDVLTLTRIPTEAFNIRRSTGAPVRAASLRKMQESCSICQDMVRKPPRNSCSHNIRYQGNNEYNVCLKCKIMFSKNFHHSKSLGNIPTDFQEPMQSPDSMPHCEHHPKQLQLLFCKDHGKTICLNCSMSPEHKGHRILTVEEVTQSYKEQIRNRLEHLKKVREAAKEKKSQGDKEMAVFLNKTETQKEQILSRLIQVHQFLEEQEQLFLAWMEELSRTIIRSKEEYNIKASQEISLLEELMEELEEKQKQSPWELLQDIRVTLMRAEWMIFPKEWAVPPELKEKVHIIFWKSECMQKSMRKFIANVTLDPETAHPQLIIFDEQKSVRLGKKCQKLPNVPQRFDNSLFVLGSPSFISGKRYWQVYVGDKTMWTLGVCKNSVNRKGSIAFSPGNGYWLVMMTKKNEYSASTVPPTPLYLGEPPRCVGIFLDYEAGDISFYNVTAKSHIYTFPFSGSSSDPLRPVFSPGLHDRGKNTDPLSICLLSS